MCLWRILSMDSRNYGNKEHLKLMILLVEKILKSDKVVQSVNDYGEK